MAGHEVRCPGGALHLKIVNGEIEVKCNHIRCTQGNRIVALHRFSADGEFLRTLTFKNPR